MPDIIFADPLQSFIQGFHQAERAELNLQTSLRQFREADRQFSFDAQADPYRLDDLRQQLRIRTTQANIAEALQQPQIDETIDQYGYNQELRPDQLQAQRINNARQQLAGQQDQLTLMRNRLEQAFSSGLAGNLQILNQELSQQGHQIQVTNTTPLPNGDRLLTITGLDANGQVNTTVIPATDLRDMLFQQQAQFQKATQAQLQGQLATETAQARAQVQAAQEDVLLQQLLQQATAR